ncbi:Dyp-type peroxidase [soil metagenome]
MTSQPAILSGVAPAARYLVLDVPPDVVAKDVVASLHELPIDDGIVVGLGEPLLRALGVDLAGLRTFPALAGPGCSIPSTQGALLLHARGDDHGDTLRTMQKALAALGGGLRVIEDVAAFRHLEGRDLTGYEDGTENPTGDQAIAAAIADDGSSYVAVQRWIHDLGGFEKLTPQERDHVFGRSIETNDELDDAPPSAHVKRAAQEDFEPAAFMVRRSMPYGTVMEHGLYFVAYARSLDPFEQVLRRMIGRDDGIVDGLFQFSRPVSGGYYWCPPIKDARLDLRAVR